MADRSAPRFGWDVTFALVADVAFLACVFVEAARDLLKGWTSRGH